MLQVIDCTETVSTNASDMFKLKLATIPHDRYVYDYLVFTANAFWGAAIPHRLARATPAPGPSG
jgi:hypothetical protein